ncbi:MAG TPA: CoA transferase, partial [Candidatus Binataceae bacterium]|nr:CoA transferase [Candidatus Binataceae bacterium]
FRCLNLPEKYMDTVIDQWVAIACADDGEWTRLARAIGRPELATDSRFANLAARKQNEDELESIINAWTSTRTVRDVVTALQAAQVASGACADNKYLSEDPQLNQRGYFVNLPHKEIGAYQHCGMPWRMSATACAVRAAAPCLGQHTDEVLTGLLGYSASELDALRKLGALD